MSAPDPSRSTVYLPSPGGFRWTSAIGAGLAAKVRGRARRLGDRGFWQRHTAGIQARQLRGLLERGAATAFGREHGYDAVLRSPDDQLAAAYRTAVPTKEYVALLPYLRRMYEDAERDVLWPGFVRCFAQTSGTTAGDKRIPISDAMMRSNYRASLDIFAHAVRWGVPFFRVFGGHALFLGGSSALTAGDNGVIIGDLSGIATQQIRWPLSAVYSPGRDIALMDHWPTKIEAMAERTAAQDVRMISGMPSWTVALFERVLEKTGTRTIEEVWPHLTLFTHGGVRYDPFAPTIRRLFSGGERDIPVRLELYPASEGFIAVQDEPGDRGLRLNADHDIFYEFVPLEDAGREDPPAFSVHEVEKGQRYVVVMTTCAGLWRYLIGDVVEFDAVPAGFDGIGGDGPCRLRIVGRHKLFINAFGENIIVENIETAVAHAAEATGIEVGEFTASPVYPGDGLRAGLQLAVEVAEPFRGRLDAFAAEFDATLQHECHDYEVKRTDGLGMAAPIVSPLEPGAVQRWMADRGKLGGQHKVPRCANHREFMDALAGPPAAEPAAQGR
ncbi:MAG: GH3 auxin-responsive promoter family protein [Planctomycetota bacterium]